MNKITKKIADAMDLSNSFQTQIIPVGPHVDNIGFNIATTGVTSNGGEFKIQHRIRHNHYQFSAWANLTLSCDVILSGVNIAELVSLNQVPIGELRVVFTVAGTSPDGTVDIWFSGRDL